MNIIITGPTGKMGKLITAAAEKRSDMTILAGVSPKGRKYTGSDIGIATRLGKEVNALVVDDIERVIENCDVIIDYTTVQYSVKVMELAKKYKKAVVCGTTGFSEEQFKRIKEVSESIPFLFAANTSRLVNLMYSLLEITAKAVGDRADIEIIEMHDRYKKDAPSGTSKEMGYAIAKALEKEWKQLAVFGREGPGQREEGSIGYHSIRSGDISSSHTVIFGLLGERLEITHHAHNWECYAQGACEAAAYLYKKKPGYYTFKDVLGI